MNKAKEILYKHAKSNGCRSILLGNPFLQQAVLNAINEALTIPDIVKSLPEWQIYQKAHELDEKEFEQWMYDNQ